MRHPWKRGNELSLGIEGINEGDRAGQGAFGVVYRARQESLGRVVAVKVLNVSHPDLEARRRFEQECRALGTLSGHPNIVAVYDCGLSDSGHPYLVMDYLSGGTLAERLQRQGPLSATEVADIGVKLAGALAAAHAAGVLHRDVKPENVLISAYGEPLLADFGVARIHGEAPTRSGMITGSLAHAAPEVLSGQPAVEASDVYSLASTLYQLLAGKSPFLRDGEESLHPLVVRILGERPADLRSAGVPEPLWEAIAAALAKDPSERTGSALVFGEALRKAQQAGGAQPTQLVIPQREGVSSVAVAEANVTRWRERPPSLPAAKRSRRSLQRALRPVALAFSLILLSGLLGPAMMDQLRRAQGAAETKLAPKAIDAPTTTTVSSSPASSPVVATDSPAPTRSRRSSTKPPGGAAVITPPAPSPAAPPPSPQSPQPDPTPQQPVPNPAPSGPKLPQAFVQTVWRGSQSFNRVVRFKADGQPDFPGPGNGWSTPVNLGDIGLPGHGRFQALSTLAYANGNAFEHCYWRENQRFCRQVNFKADGTPDWPGAPNGWSAPVTPADLELPGDGDIQAANLIAFANGKAFSECYQRTNQGFCREVPFKANGTPDWSAAPRQWSGPFGTENLPGAGQIQAIDTLVHQDGRGFTQNLWRGNQGFWRQVKFRADGKPDWPNSSWSGTIDLAKLPGTGEILATNILVYAPPRP